MKSTTHGTAPDSKMPDPGATNFVENSDFPEVLKEELRNYGRMAAEMTFFMMCTAVECYRMAEQMGATEGFLDLLSQGVHPAVALSTQVWDVYGGD